MSSVMSTVSIGVIIGLSSILLLMVYFCFYRRASAGVTTESKWLNDVYNLEQQQQAQSTTESQDEGMRLCDRLLQS